MAATLLKQAEYSIDIVVEDWEDLVLDSTECDNWEDIIDKDLIMVVAKEKDIDEEEEDLTAIEIANSPQTIINKWYADNAARQADWVAEQQRNNCIITRKLPNKTWKSINNCKGNIDALAFIKMIYRTGMMCRWKKNYKKHFPTWHAIGPKWQGQINGFVNDYIKTLKAQKEYEGGYENDFWMDSIIQVTKRILPRIIKRAHKHTAVIIESMLEDSAKLDWGIKNLHENLII